MFLKELGKNIQKHRLAQGMTMEKLGLECGLTRMQVNRIEKGLNVTMSTLLKISLALDLKPSELLKIDYQPKKDDIDVLINYRQRSASQIASKTKKKEEVKIIQFNEELIQKLKKDKNNKELIEAVKDLQEALKRIGRYRNKKIS